jgi:CRP/FNR family cyclic AMP-dependent transcriptional regulator
VGTGLGSATSRAATVAAGTPAAGDFLTAVGPELAGELTARGVARSFPRGHALFHEGQVADRVLILRKGRVKTLTTTAGGREVVLEFRGPGEVVGEQAALDGGLRSATVCAVEPVEALSVDASAFRAFVIANPPASLALLVLLSRKLRAAEAKRTELSAFTTIERVAARLLELAERYGEDDAGSIRIDLPLSQEELAGATGSSIESVARALQTMRSLKCLATRRREIRILDVEALEALRRAAG